ncbi:MAG TPA: DMT family transporter [Paludibacteraceae bacterium]|nr:DMT family transporter [Paludibacteraceae bacterium]
MEHKAIKGHIALFAANILFGLNNPISRSLIPETISPYFLTFCRLVGGMLLFWFFSLFLPKEKVPIKDVILLFFAAIFALSANQLPFIVGLSMTSSIDAAIVITLLPVMSMVFAFFILREPISSKKVVGVCIGALGAVVLIYSSYHIATGTRNMWGNSIVFSAVIAFSLYLTLFKDLISRYSPVTVMKWMFLFASIQCYPFFHAELMQVSIQSFDMYTLIRIAYVVIIATFITYILLAIGQKVLRPTTLSMYNYLQPIVASLAAVAMGIDSLGIHQLIAALCVFLGVYLVTQSKSRVQIEAQENNHQDK